MPKRELQSTLSPGTDPLVPGDISTAPLKRPPGRPPALVADQRTIQLVNGLGRLQCTTKECAAMLGVTEKTYIGFRDANPAVAEAYEAGTGMGRVSLRRTQFRLAEKSAAMAIFLGKNYLGQVDRIEHGGDGLSVNFIIDGPRPREERNEQRAIPAPRQRQSEGPA